MPTFKYTALTKDRHRVTGVIDAYDELAVADLIKDRFPIVLKVEKVNKDKVDILNIEIGSKQIPLKQLSLLCSEFSIIINAGMPLAKAVGMVADQTKDKRIKKLLKDITIDVKNGYTLADSIENKGQDYFPPSFIETVRAGETSGTMDKSFSSLQTYYEKQAYIKEKVKGAMTYPVFLLGLAAVVIAVVLGVAMPVFKDMFSEFDTEMPALTQMVIDVSDFFSRNVLIIVIIILTIIMGFKLYKGTEEGRLNLAKLSANVPILKNVVLMNSASQLANTLSTLLASGIPMVQSVQVTSKVMDNYYMSQKLAACVNKIEEGKSLGDCLKDARCFPDMLVEMVAMGEDTGSLEDTLRTIGGYFDEEVNNATKKMLDALQPMITVFLGLIIGTIVISLYLPMFSLYGGM